MPYTLQTSPKPATEALGKTRIQESSGRRLTSRGDAAVYEDTLNGCPARSTNTAGVDDAADISAVNPRAYRPTQLHPAGLHLIQHTAPQLHL